MRQMSSLTHFLSLIGAKIPPFQREIAVPLQQVSKQQPLKNYKSKQTMQNKLFRMMLFLLTMLITVGSTDAAKKVHTLGDSTMAPYDESATNTRGWGMYFGNFQIGRAHV